MIEKESFEVHKCIIDWLMSKDMNFSDAMCLLSYALQCDKSITVAYVDLLKMEKNKIHPEMCECGRLYKDRVDENGKMMCSACYTGYSVEDLKKLWGTPIPDDIKKYL